MKTFAACLFLTIGLINLHATDDTQKVGIVSMTPSQKFLDHQMDTALFKVVLSRPVLREQTNFTADTMPGVYINPIIDKNKDLISDTFFCEVTTYGADIGTLRLTFTYQSAAVTLKRTAVVDLVQLTQPVYQFSKEDVLDLQDNRGMKVVTLREEAFTKEAAHYSRFIVPGPSDEIDGVIGDALFKTNGEGTVIVTLEPVPLVEAMPRGSMGTNNESISQDSETFQIWREELKEQLKQQLQVEGSSIECETTARVIFTGFNIEPEIDHLPEATITWDGWTITGVHISDDIDFKIKVSGPSVEFQGAVNLSCQFKSFGVIALPMISPNPFLDLQPAFEPKIGADISINDGNGKLVLRTFEYNLNVKGKLGFEWDERTGGKPIKTVDYITPEDERWSLADPMFAPQGRNEAEATFAPNISGTFGLAFRLGNRPAVYAELFEIKSAVPHTLNYPKESVELPATDDNYRNGFWKVGAETSFSVTPKFTTASFWGWEERKWKGPAIDIFKITYPNLAHSGTPVLSTDSTTVRHGVLHANVLLEGAFGPYSYLAYAFQKVRVYYRKKGSQNWKLGGGSNLRFGQDGIYAEVVASLRDEPGLYDVVAVVGDLLLNRFTDGLKSNIETVEVLPGAGLAAAPYQHDLIVLKDKPENIPFSVLNSGAPGRQYELEATVPWLTINPGPYNIGPDSERQHMFLVNPSLAAEEDETVLYVHELQNGVRVGTIEILVNLTQVELSFSPENILMDGLVGDWQEHEVKINNPSDFPITIHLEKPEGAYISNVNQMVPAHGQATFTLEMQIPGFGASHAVLSIYDRTPTLPIDFKGAWPDLNMDFVHGHGFRRSTSSNGTQTWIFFSNWDGFIGFSPSYADNPDMAYPIETVYANADLWEDSWGQWANFFTRDFHYAWLRVGTICDWCDETPERYLTEVRPLTRGIKSMKSSGIWWVTIKFKPHLAQILGDNPR